MRGHSVSPPIFLYLSSSQVFPSLSTRRTVRLSLSHGPFSWAKLFTVKRYTHGAASASVEMRTRAGKSLPF